MSSRTLQNAESGPLNEMQEVHRGIEVWLRLALVEEFDRIAREPLPDFLLDLLPTD